MVLHQAEVILSGALHLCPGSIQEYNGKYLVAFWGWCSHGLMLAGIVENGKASMGLLGQYDIRKPQEGTVLNICMESTGPEGD